MTTTEKLLTAEEFACLPDNGMQQELVDGKVIEMPPAFPDHGGVCALVTIALGSHVLPRGLSRLLSNDAGFVLRRNPDTVRGPDVCFIAAERLPGGRLPGRYVELVPDLIVEVVSPGTTAAEARRRARMWLDAGARLVWTLFPRTRTVGASLPGVADRTLKATDTLTGEPVLPGFSVPVAALFGP